MKITADLGRVFVTSDHHFGHDNIRGYCDRPFDSVEEMDYEMIRRWNEVVGPDDEVYHLGDFTLGGWEQAKGYFKQLNGKIGILSYPWHHDRRWLGDPWHIGLKSVFDRVELLPPMVVLEVPELGDDRHPLAITLCHYPMARWDRAHYGAWSLHGHTHGRFQGPDGSLDVGVDSHDFRPWSLAEIAAVMQRKGAE